MPVKLKGEMVDQGDTCIYIISTSKKNTAVC